MDFVLYILSLGLVWLRTFRLAHGLVRWNMSAGVHARARGGCVIQWCQNKNPRSDLGMWMTSCTGSVRGWFWGFGGIWKKSVSWVPGSEEDGWFSLAHRGLVAGATRVGGWRWKSQNRKNVYLFPYVEEPLNSKVIKSFVPELRSRVFRVSGFLCSMYICYEHSMYISHIRIMGMVHYSNN